MGAAAQHRAAAAAAFQVAQQMREAEKVLTTELAAIDALVATDPRPSVGETVPPASRGQYSPAAQQNPRAAPPPRRPGAQRSPRRVHPPPGPPAPSASTLNEQLQQPLQQPLQQQRDSSAPRSSDHSVLHKRLESETARAQQLVTESAEKLKEAFVRLDPLAGRAKIHFSAMRHMADWRQYAELIERAEDIVRFATELGAEGLHSYFIENESGRFGPFELEQHVQIGSLDIAVRLAAPGALEIIDAQTGKPLSRGTGGIIVMHVDDPKTGARFPTTFRYAGDCDDLANQLSDSIYQATQIVDALSARLRPPEGWLGKFHEALNAASGGNRLKSDHQVLLNRWSAVCDDLLALKRFKERLATLRLLQRVEALAPGLISRQSEATRSLNESTQRVAAIVAASSRDEDTGRLLIPHRHAREYADQLRRRDDAHAAIEHFQRLLTAAADDVRRRVNDSPLRGVAGLPRLHILTIIPTEWESLAQMGADDELTRRLTALETILNSPLRPLDAFPVTPLKEIDNTAGSSASTRKYSRSPDLRDSGPEPTPKSFSSADQVQGMRMVEELEVIEFTEIDAPPPPPSRLPPPPQPR